jgi:hypothetical protein
MAIGKLLPALLRRYANMRIGSTGHSLPESLATLTARLLPPHRLDLLVGLDHSAATIRGSGTKSQSNGLSIIRFPVE